jgi:hypothetical protein
MYLSAGQAVSVTVGSNGAAAPADSWADGGTGGASFVTISGTERIRAGGGAGGRGQFGSEGGSGGTGSTHSSVETAQVYAGGRGGNAYLLDGSYHNGGGGGSAGNSQGSGVDGGSGTNPLGATARTGVLALGAGGRGYFGPNGGEILPGNGGIGAGSVSTHLLFMAAPLLRHRQSSHSAKPAKLGTSHLRWHIFVSG